MSHISKTPVGTIVDIHGDGVWPAMAEEIKNTLLDPYFGVEWKVFDLSLQGRDKTDDKILADIEAAMLQYRTAVKGPTITPTEEEAKTFKLKKVYGSPNGALRKAINGAAIFRSPIEYKGIKKNIPDMEGVTIARQAVGGIYGAPEFKIEGKGKIEITFTDEAGNKTTKAEWPVKGPGVGMMTTETDKSINDYAHATFQYAIFEKKSVVLSTKHTINKIYDGQFIKIFEKVFAESYADQFKKLGLEFDGRMLIDTAAAKIPQAKLNNWIVALKNYDGDVQSDMVAGGHVSLGLMDSSLVSADGVMLTDPPHGTAPDLEPAFHKEGKLLANPTAYIFAYANAVRHQATMHNNTEAASRAEILKASVIQTIEAGFTTGDLTPKGQKSLTGQEFMAKVREAFEKGLQSGQGLRAAG